MINTFDMSRFAFPINGGLVVQRSRSAFSSPSFEGSGTYSFKKSTSTEFELERVLFVQDSQGSTPSPSRESELTSILLRSDSHSSIQSPVRTESRLETIFSKQSPERFLSSPIVPDLYRMLKYTLSPQDNRWEYKKDLTRALMSYTSFTYTNVSFPCKMIEILGKDKKPFSVSRNGVECLCEIIRDDISIRYFRFIAKQEKGDHRLLANDQVGDEAVEILADNLPWDRFELLEIAGAFGNNAARALLDRIPVLLRNGFKNPKIYIYGEKITDVLLIDRCRHFASLKYNR